MYSILRLGFYSNVPNLIQKIIDDEKLDALADFGYTDGSKLIWLTNSSNYDFCLNRVKEYFPT